MSPLKSVAYVILICFTVEHAFAQPNAPDPAQLKLAGDTLEAMGKKLDRAQLDQAWRSNFVSSQAKSRHFSDAQAEAFFQMIRPSLEAQNQKLFEVRQRSLALAFSHDELLMIIGFYKSPVGQKLIQNERQVAPGLTATQRASFKDVFAHMMAAADALSTVAAKPNTPAPGHVQ